MSERPIGDHSFQQYLNEEKLMGVQCDSCSALFVPPQAVCSNCHGTALAWVQMKGTGKLAAFTCIAVCPPSMAAEGFGRDNPFCTGVVDLDEKTRVVARIEGVDTKSPDSIKIGSPVKAAFLQNCDGSDPEAVLVFRPA